ncbi:DUF1800 domain-containing protein [Gemmobacter denitrificans]|uniref:DUF1800 domain-containing protein n=1 Tax=Gemmobacter denitrificans TaxID=3123040 RepID=A0ABU8BRX6_9RHOB
MTEAADILAFRFGTGLPLTPGAPQDATAVLALLAGPDLAAQAFPTPSPDAVLEVFARVSEARRVSRQTQQKAARKAYGKVLQEVLAQEQAILRAQIARAVDTQDGFRERLVAFWADHFSTGTRLRDHRALSAARMDEAIRPHLAGRFADLLKAAIQHPSMLIYLDQTASRGPGSRQAQGRKRGGLNENLARELIELHTMGVGAGYSQEDVRQLAELLTGLSFEQGQGTVFNPAMAEPGAETVLGRDYRGKGLAPILAVLDDLARRPETARHLAQKLAVHFLADQPDPALVDRMAAAYLAAETALMPVYEVMLTDAAALSPKMNKARQPFDFMSASLRALGVDGAGVLRMAPKPFERLIRAPMKTMGQDWGQAPGPDGWAEEVTAWITPLGLAARIDWAMTVPGRLVSGGMPDPRDLARRALGSLASPVLLQAVARAESPREGVGLVLASAEFNRR